MIPPIYQLLAASPAVVAIVGDRIGECGEVMPTETRPYLTWLMVSSVPDNVLEGGRAPDDHASVQIDLYHTGMPGLRALSEAARSAVESECVVTSVGPCDRDAETRLYHFRLEADYIVTRS
jgi:hypothetical protein